MQLKKPKLIDSPKTTLKSYSFISLLANILIAVSYGLSLAFGMGAISFSPTVIILAMGFVAILGGVGRFLKQQSSEKDEDDV